MKAISKTIHYSEYNLFVMLSSNGLVYYLVDSGPLYPCSLGIFKSSSRYYVCPVGDSSIKYHVGSKNSCYFFIVDFIRQSLSL